MTRIVCLIPAHNEASCIASTIHSALSQSRAFDLVVVVPNGCTDRTAEVARGYPVEVFELGKLEHRKTEALNLAWLEYCQDADLVVTIDADTELESEAVEKWLTEFEEDPLLGGSQARFTMRGKELIVRLQKAEYALGIDRSLRKKSTGILAGASSCYRNRALKRVMESDGRVGPWSYDSAVEDFELTYRLRQRAYRCIVSPTIRAYTDAMPNLKHLHAQRLKWQTGTVEDIIRFGYNKLTRENWTQQMVGLLMAVVTLGWMSLLAITFIRGGSVSLISWWSVIPAVSAMVNLKNANRIPNRDWIDLVIGGTLVVGEIYGTIRLAWMVQAWAEVIWTKITKKRKDRWELQGIAEGIYQQNLGVDTVSTQNVR